MNEYIFLNIFFHAGRESLSHVLSLDQNLTCLFPFLSMSEEVDGKVKKSVCCRYSSVLLNTMLHHTYNVEYVERFRQQLLDIPKKGTSC